MCPLNCYGQRCSIEHSPCLSDLCLHQRSCFPGIELDRVICLCTKGCFGSRCQSKRSSIYLFLSTPRPRRTVVLQILQIDLSSLELLLRQQQVFILIPEQMEYYHQDRSPITDSISTKFYSSSDEITLPAVHLPSISQHVRFSSRSNRDVSQHSISSNLPRGSESSLFLRRCLSFAVRWQSHSSEMCQLRCHSRSMLALSFRSLLIKCCLSLSSFLQLSEVGRDLASPFPHRFLLDLFHPAIVEFLLAYCPFIALLR